MESKTLLKSLVTIVVFSLMSVCVWAAPQDSPEQVTSGPVTIVCTEDLYELAVSWAEGYNVVYPDAEVTVVREGESVGMAENTLFLGLAESGDENLPVWEITIAKDALVVIYNTDNPKSEFLSVSGIKMSDLTTLLAQVNDIKWSTIIPEGGDSEIDLYIENGVIGNQYSPKSGEAGLGREDLLKAVQNNKYSIGIIRLSSLTGTEESLPAGLGFLPVDKNGNGRLDSFENIYSSSDDLLRGIWIGKYPQQLCSRIVVTTPQKPVDEGAVAFLAWVLNSGNETLAVNGYTPIPDFVKNANLALLTEPEVATFNDGKPLFAGVLIPLFSVIVAAALIGVIVVRSRKRKPVHEEINPEIATALNPSLITSPSGLFFDKSHTWAYMEMNGFVRVGIDDFLQHITGEITGVSVIKPGTYVRRGETLVTIIQEGKHLDVKSPVTGLIRSLNSDLESDSTLINKSPYGNGWVCLIEPGNWKRETEFMFMATRFREWISTEFIRLRDFFAYAMRESDLVYNRIVLQDGGEIRDKVLSEFGPEVWEEFQVKFIDASK